ncbi:hypothetical protein [Prevotella sp. KH2C16]|uniref:hypothetical protein n=1 Tax=Prevotella sp. KH2C16 TaxID=1855325 RepID=UPI0008F445EF|nr:hypothetical protein [Prevotella sp. KH2C16]SFG62025.1 hypothetical protein SAMN05216383_12320 [Prevotella sp. KH2C16]
MKKFILALTALLTLAVSASAMSYEQAREQALFLTDKMAYELNLTDDQYEAAYEINLDYLMRINDYNDLYGVYWRQRNLDLSYILLDWQYRTYCAARYFYRPLYWDAGVWHFSIYARYPHRDYFYFGRPHFVEVYYGGHSWAHNGGRSWYHGRQYGGTHPNGIRRIGMRDGFDRGDFGNGTRITEFGRTRSHGNFNQSTGNGNRTFGGRHNGNGVSTRSLGQAPGAPRTFGGRRDGNRANPGRERDFGRDNGSGIRSSTRSTAPRMGAGFRSFSRDNNTPTRSFAPNNENPRPSAPSRSMGAPSRSFGGSFGSSRPGSSLGRGGFGGGRSGGSFGGGSHSSGINRGGRSFGGGHR